MDAKLQCPTQAGYTGLLEDFHNCIDPIIGVPVTNFLAATSSHLFNFSYIPSSAEYLRNSLQGKLFFNVIEKFELDLAKKSHLVAGHVEHIRSYFNQAVSSISTLIPTNVIVNLTDNNSIYFRFYNVPLIETHLEVFYIKDSEDDFVEAVLTSYQNEEIILKQFGLFNDVFSSLRNTLKGLNTNAFKIQISVEKLKESEKDYALSI